MNRDEFATFPIDSAALDPDPDDRKLSCSRCRGALVTEAEVARVLAELLRHDEPKPLSFDKPIGSEPLRTCPRCLQAMTKHGLYGIQIDRCEAHGLWFDSEEMARVLNEAGMRVVKKERFREGLKAAAITTVFIGAQLIQFLFA